MFEDGLKILEEERGMKDSSLLRKEDVEKALSLWNALPYHTKRELKGGLSVYFKDAGHILGFGNHRNRL